MSRSDASLIVDTKGTKGPVYSKDARRYSEACRESRGIATVSLSGEFRLLCFFSIGLTQ